MSSRVVSGVVGISLCALALGPRVTQAAAEDGTFLTWSSARAQEIIRAARVKGRVGAALDFRFTHTERSYNYKLRATWLTADVIRGTARLVQLADRLTNQETERLVVEATNDRTSVILVEIDPREGSGVIPLDWVATLEPRASRSGVRGVNRPEYKSKRALSGGFRRDYDYEVFWLEFPLVSESGARLFPPDTHEAELVIRIHDKEGRVTWPIPDSLRRESSDSSALLRQTRLPVFGT
jgi:hypothetical protein